MSFQFHYGTIKSNIKERFKQLLQILFQFHYGTIKRLCGQALRPFSSTFQFHYGTIKRIHAVFTSPSFGNFNSTMVRLKGLAGHWLRVFKQFQFHYGTIKRTCGHVQISGRYNFNSTMVRLKVALKRSKRRGWTAFQFHYGTIKSRDVLKYPKDAQAFQFHYGTIKSQNYLRSRGSVSYFNSTMVRLKDSMLVCAGVFDSISIPLWYD